MACKQDPDVKLFDSKLQQHATSVINTLSTTVDNSGNGFQQQVGSLSFDSITQVTGSLMDMNHEVVKVILDCKEDVWKNKELLSLVEDYFEYSVQTLDFFAKLDQCLKRARDRHLIVQVALRRFEEEMRVDQGSSEISDKFSSTLLELRSFKEAGDPFGQEFFGILQSVYTQQIQMLRRLQIRKRKLDKKLKSVKLGTYLSVKDLDNIRVLVQKLEIVIDSLLSNADFALRDADTLPMVMDDIRNKLNVFMEGIDSITAHSDKYSKEISLARSVILHRIMKYPSAPI
uniref:Uncharacterized protein n=1 Tax=Chenopodium quinoa TaxID=63459 RepID=A0A803KVY9_CHEQI